MDIILLTMHHMHHIIFVFFFNASYWNVLDFIISSTIIYNLLLFECDSEFNLECTEFNIRLMYDLYVI